MRALLIYNPSSGNNRARRQHQVAAVEAAFDAAGNQTDILATAGPGSAPQQVREHCARTPVDAVIACGGDGTMNEVLQAMVADRIPAALGIIPLGTGNVVGNDLGLSRNPAIAARQLITAKPTRIAVGQISYINALLSRRGWCRWRRPAHVPHCRRRTKSTWRHGCLLRHHA
jgi:diacylglycerol kinase (ATP)